MSKKRLYINTVVRLEITTDNENEDTLCDIMDNIKCNFTTNEPGAEIVKSNIDDWDLSNVEYE